MWLRGRLTLRSVLLYFLSSSSIGLETGAAVGLCDRGWWQAVHLYLSFSTFFVTYSVM